MVSDFSNTVYQNADRQQEDFTQILKKISSTDKIRAIDVEENAGRLLSRLMMILQSPIYIMMAKAISSLRYLIKMVSLP